MGTIATDAQESREMVVDFLIEAGIRRPDKVEHSFAKWDVGTDGYYVIFRANYRGPFGTLDTGWIEDDGHVNGLFCPVTYEFLPWLARDVRALLAVEGRPSRDLLRSLGKRDPKEG